MASESKTEPMSFESIQQGDVPKGREGKHKKIISMLMKDIDRLKPGTALKVPLDELPDTKENIRSALNRATRQHGLEVSTSSDENHLYIWITEPKK
jgi:TusA-related sulfurtransferase